MESKNNRMSQPRTRGSSQNYSYLRPRGDISKRIFAPELEKWTMPRVMVKATFIIELAGEKILICGEYVGCLPVQEEQEVELPETKKQRKAQLDSSSPILSR